MRQSLNDICRRLVLENNARPRIGPLPMERLRKPRTQSFFYALPPPVVEYLHKRFDYLNPRRTFYYRWEGRWYRSFYHAWLAALSDTEVRPDWHDLIDYSTYTDLVRLRKKGIIATIAFNEQTYRGVTAALLRQRWTLPDQAKRLIYDTFRSPIHFRERARDGIYLGYQRAEGFNLYGEELARIRDEMIGLMPGYYAEVVSLVRRASHGYKRCGYIDYYLGYEKPEGYTRSRAKLLAEKKQKSSKRTERYS